MQDDLLQAAAQGADRQRRRPLHGPRPHVDRHVEREVLQVDAPVLGGDAAAFGLEGGGERGAGHREEQDEEEAHGGGP